jgi:hypothetical protein
MTKTNLKSEINYDVNTEIVYHTPEFWTSKSSRQFNEGMVIFNSHNIKIAKNGIVTITASVKRKYILLDDIMDVVKPLLAEVGIYIEQHLAGDSLITRIVHISGEFIASKMPYQTMDGGSANALQKLGGGLSYLRRYSICAILNIVADDDSDGEAIDNISYKSNANVKSPAPSIPASTNAPASPEQQWLNMRDKKGALTDNGKNAFLYLDGGGKIEDIKAKYKISKVDLADLEKYLSDKLNASQNNYQAEEIGMFDNNELLF